MKQSNLTTSCTQNEAESARKIWLERVTEKETGYTQPGACADVLPRCCPRLEALNDYCACSVFNYIPDLHGRETRVAVAGKWVLFTFTKWKMADRDSCKEKKCVECPRRKTNPAHMQQAWDCGQFDVCVTSASVNSPISTLIKSTTWPRTKPCTIYTSSSSLI